MTNKKEYIKKHELVRDINRLTTIISTLDFMEGNSSIYLPTEWLESTLYSCKNTRASLKKVLRELEEGDVNETV